MLHCHTFWFKWNNVRKWNPFLRWGGIRPLRICDKDNLLCIKGSEAQKYGGKPEIYGHEPVNKLLINSRAAALKESTHDWAVQSIVDALSSEHRFNFPLKLIWSSERNDQCVGHDDAESEHTQRWCLFTWWRRNHLNIWTSDWPAEPQTGFLFPLL